MEREGDTYAELDTDELRSGAQQKRRIVRKIKTNVGRTRLAKDFTFHPWSQRSPMQAAIQRTSQGY